MGVHIVANEWIDASKKQIDSGASEAFGKGDYKFIAGAMNLVLSDLILMGYNVLMQDVDIAWVQDPRPYLHARTEFDIQVVSDGRARHLDKKRNGGFVYYRHNCRTRVYAGTLTKCMAHIIWRRSDQIIMNRLLDNENLKGFVLACFQTLSL